MESGANWYSISLTVLFAATLFKNSALDVADARSLSLLMKSFR